MAVVGAVAGIAAGLVRPDSDLEQQVAAPLEVTLSAEAAVEGDQRSFAVEGSSGVQKVVAEVEGEAANFDPESGEAAGVVWKLVGTQWPGD